MVEMISAISGLLVAISLLLGVLFLWRFGPAMGAGIRRLADIIVVAALTRDRQQLPTMARILEGAALLELEAVTALNTATENKKRGYEIGYFARKHSISKEEAGKLIKRVGNDREKLNRAAERFKKAAPR